MRGRLTCHLALSAVAMLALLPDSAAAQTGPVEAVQAARVYLEREVDRAREDSTYFPRRWYVEGVTDFSAVSLGEPWAECLFGSQAIGDFADSKVAEFGEGALFLNWAFPVLYQGNGIGTIIHAGYHNGMWDVGGMTLAKSPFRPPFISFITRVREEYPPERGYRVAVLIAGQMGTYALLYVDGELSKIAQVYPDPYGILGFPMDEDGFGVLLPIEEARDHLLTLARRYKDPSYKRDAVREE